MNLIFSNKTTVPGANIGGKAGHLILAKEKGFNVPEFVVIPADYLDALIPVDAERAKELVLNYQFSEELLTALYAPFEDDDLVAVRSSAINEDGITNSFAGQYETKLFVKKADLDQALRAVWLSAYSDRVASYKKQNNITGSGMAIIVQRMIDSEVSGVAFALNPLTGDTNETVINAAFGLGEGIVSGALDADLFTVKKGAIGKKIAVKKWAFRHGPGNTGTIKVPLNDHLSQEACLNEEQISAVDALVKRLSAHFKLPQDIEFAYHNNKLYLLQTRPITAVATKTKEALTIWDNSNIIESYPGLTLPLTFSFIEKMYEAVYTQLSLIMGIRARTVAQNADVYANMLGLLCGRVYYNLNNWHKTLSLLPGYTINAAFMDNMMGVKERFDTTIEHKGSKLSEYYNVLTAVLKIVKRHNRLEKDRIAFRSYFHNVMQEYDTMDLEAMSKQDLVKNYLRFEDTLVKKWEAPLVNDFFCMIYFGVLQKLVNRYELDENGNLHNDLVSGSKDIISTEPITLTLSIAKLISETPEASMLFQGSSPRKILMSLQKGAFPAIHAAIKSYIKKWGERCVGELKLETVTYKQDPENYIKILQSYVRNRQYKVEHKESSVRRDAEEKVKKELKGKPVKKRIFSFVLKKARYLVSNRENLRFERTRGFGMVRTMMCALGRKLSRELILEDERDVFYLKQHELFEFVRSNGARPDLKELVSNRKKEYATFEQIKLPERIKASPMTNDFSVFERREEHIARTDILQGIGCCSGIVRARVSVIHSPGEIDSLNNTILVTASTDPGWVVLFPSAAAIIVERGSLLSHSAIVSREMGIPCVVGVKNLLDILETGDLVELDGTKGTIKIFEKA